MTPTGPTPAESRPGLARADPAAACVYGHEVGAVTPRARGAVRRLLGLAPAGPGKPDPARVLREASDVSLFVHYHAPQDWEYPDPEQWAACLSDLKAAPAGAWWTLKRAGKPLVLLFDRPCTDHPAYYDLKGVPLGTAEGATGDTAVGLGWPVPMARVNRSYPWTPNGLAHAGTSPPLHEVGHALDRYLDGRFAADPFRPSLCRQDDFQRVWKAAAWWSRLLALNAAEAFAESFAAWCVRNAGDPYHKLPVADPMVYDFWDRTGRSLGWGD